MASSNNGGVEDQELKKMADLSKTLKEGERILAPTRRPDGTLRKPIRIRAGYVPQDEVAIYQSKGALLKKEMASHEVVPPGYDPALDTKPKSKSVKRNERKKEKRLQAAAHEKGKTVEQIDDEETEKEELASPRKEIQSVKSLTSQMNELAVSSNPAEVAPPSDSTEDSNIGGPVQDIDKKIRALKKKIRLTEVQKEKTPTQDMTPEQLDKFTKLEGWRQELKLLENRKAELASS
ncbi:hypothetical protein UlMin_033802 [Ulmus minor]